MKIDFVVAWVDGNDPKWQKEKAKYDNKPKTVANSEARYRDWDQLKYWFRGVEKFAPWVNKVYFVTCGQKPDWLDENNPKLVLVDHKDYIPNEYLPTFSANPIELNFHRIKGLSEHFVYFNDDMFIINPVIEEDFFKNDLPCDDYGEAPLITYGNGDIFPYLLANDSEFANKHYNKRKVFRKNFFKYINFKYGLKTCFKTLLMLTSSHFSCIDVSHIPSSFLKETYREVWKKESELLSKVSSYKFRTKDDVNQYIFKYYQFFENKFYPRSRSFGTNIPIGNDNKTLIKALRGKKYKVLCINDGADIADIEKTKMEINKVFDEKFPDKSSFEK